MNPQEPRNGVQTPSLADTRGEAADVALHDTGVEGAAWSMRDRKPAVTATAEGTCTSADKDPQRFVPAPVRELRLKLMTTGLGVLFLFTGLTKLMGWQWQVDAFELFGFPGWFLIVVGFMEMGFGALTLIRPTRAYGAMGLAVIMAGAAFTHVMSGVLLYMLFLNCMLFPAAVWVVIKQRPKFLKLR